MKIYMSENDVPEDCNNCYYYGEESGCCCLNGIYRSGYDLPKDCPLQSLEQHDNDVRREFAEKIKASVCENAYTVYYNKFSSDNGMTEDGFAELIDDLLKQYEVKE